MAPFFVTHLRVMHVTQTSEKQSQTEQPKSTEQTKKSSRKSILAFAVFALGINTAAAVYTLSPSDFALPHISSLAGLLPQQSFRSNTRSSCRRLEGYSVGPAATFCRVARE